VILLAHYMVTMRDEEDMDVVLHAKSGIGWVWVQVQARTQVQTLLQ